MENKIITIIDGEIVYCGDSEVEAYKAYKSIARDKKIQEWGVYNARAEVYQWGTTPFVKRYEIIE